MIDIHAHILAGFDDGPVSMDESVEMVSLASQGRISQLIATPHSPHIVGKSYREPDVRLAVRELQGQLDGLRVDVEVFPGMEVQVDSDLERERREGIAFTLAGSRYLLLELPFSMYPPYAEQVITDLQLAGLVPILAHPERLEYFQENPNLLGRLIRSGALAQLTADSLVGGFGQRARVVSRLMLEHNLVHFLASDAHDSHYRVPGLAVARDVAEGMVGAEAADALVEGHPAAVIHNREIMVTEPRGYAPPRRWFGSAKMG
jgi:protein-tyrosine phosphatase